MTTAAGPYINLGKKAAQDLGDPTKKKKKKLSGTFTQGGPDWTKLQPSQEDLLAADPVGQAVQEAKVEAEALAQEQIAALTIQTDEGDVSVADYIRQVEEDIRQSQEQSQADIDQLASLASQINIPQIGAQGIQPDESITDFYSRALAEIRKMPGPELIDGEGQPKLKEEPFSDQYTQVEKYAKQQALYNLLYPDVALEEGADPEQFTLTVGEGDDRQKLTGMQALTAWQEQIDASKEWREGTAAQAIEEAKAWEAEQIAAINQSVEDYLAGVRTSYEAQITEYNAFLGRLDKTQVEVFSKVEGGGWKEAYQLIDDFATQEADTPGFDQDAIDAWKISLQEAEEDSNLNWHERIGAAWDQSSGISKLFAPLAGVGKIDHPWGEIDIMKSMQGPLDWLHDELESPWSAALYEAYTYLPGYQRGEEKFRAAGGTPEILSIGGILNPYAWVRGTWEAAQSGDPLDFGRSMGGIMFRFAQTERQREKTEIYKELNEPAGWALGFLHPAELATFYIAPGTVLKGAASAEKAAQISGQAARMTRYTKFGAAHPGMTKAIVQTGKGLERAAPALKVVEAPAKMTLWTGNMGKSTVMRFGSVPLKGGAYVGKLGYQGLESAAIVGKESAIKGMAVKFGIAMKRLDAVTAKQTGFKWRLTGDGFDVYAKDWVEADRLVAKVAKGEQPELIAAAEERYFIPSLNRIVGAEEMEGMQIQRLMTRGTESQVDGIGESIFRAAVKPEGLSDDVWHTGLSAWRQEAERSLVPSRILRTPLTLHDRLNDAFPRMLRRELLAEKRLPLAGKGVGSIRMPQYAAEFPVLHGILNAIDPTTIIGAGYDDVVKRAGIVWHRARQSNQWILNEAEANLRALGDWRKAFGIDESGMCAKVSVREGHEGASLAIGDIFEHGLGTKASNYALTSQQEQMIRAAHQFIDEVTEIAEARGLNFRKMFFEEGDHYFPRFVLGKDGIAKEIKKPSGTRFSTKLKQGERAFTDMEEGIAQGWNYVNDPLAVLLRHGKATLNTVADEEFHNILKGRGLSKMQIVEMAHPGLHKQVVRATARHKVLRGDYKHAGLEQTIEKARRGVIPTAREMRKWEKISPSIADDLRNAPRVISAQERQLENQIFDLTKRLDVTDDAFWDSYALMSDQNRGALASALLNRRAAAIDPEDVAEIDRLLRVTDALEAAEDAAYSSLRPRGEPPIPPKPMLRPMGEPPGLSPGPLFKSLEAPDDLVKDFWDNLSIRAKEEVTQAGKLADEQQRILTKAKERAAAVTSHPGTKEYKAAAGQLGQPERVPLKVSPSFAPTAFSAEDAQAIIKIMGDTPNTYIQKIAELQAIPRAALTAVDFGFLGLQLLPLAAMRPDRYAVVVRDTFRAMADPEFGPRWIARAENKAILQEVPDIAVMIGAGGEYTEALGAGGMLARIGRGTYNPLQMFTRGFETAGTMGRIEMAKALRPLAKNSEDLAMLGDFVNQATGTMSTRALGIGATQRGLESVLLFAPRYNRAAFALVAAAFEGNLKGRLAREMLGHLMIAGLASYVAICKAAGQEPNLNPASGGFLTLKIGDQHFGIPGIWTQLAKFAANVVTADPEDFLKLNPADYTTRKDNPLVKIIAGRLSPGAGTAWDVMLGRTFLGEQLDSFPDYTEHILKRNGLPFWLQGWFESRGSSPLASLAEFTVGARTWPLAYWEQRNELRDKYAKHDFNGKRWNQLLPREKDMLIERYPDLAEATELAELDRLKRGGISEERQYERKQKAEEIEADRASKLKVANQEFAANLRLRQRLEAGDETLTADEIDQAKRAGGIFREANDGVIADISVRYQQLRKDFEDVYEQFAEWAEEGKELLTVQQMAYEEWTEMMFEEPGLQDELGRPNYDEIGRRRDLFRDKWGDAIYHAVTKKSLPEGLDMVNELIKARKYVSGTGYWDVEDTLVGVYPRSAEEREAIARRKAMDYLRREAPEAAAQIDANPNILYGTTELSNKLKRAFQIATNQAAKDIMILSTAVEEKRNTMRRADPQLDFYLMTFYDRAEVEQLKYDGPEYDVPTRREIKPGSITDRETIYAT